jgi:thiol-disulfide isomerase/thioredoxin
VGAGGVEIPDITFLEERMLSLKRFLLVSLLAVAILAGSLPALADDIFVSNRPFQGPISGSGGDTYVGAAALAKALGTNLVRAQGSWVAGAASVPAGTPGGSVVFAGKVIPSRGGPGGAPMVHLKSAAEALGYVVRVNPQMKSIDVNRAVAKVVPPTPRPSRSAGTSASAPAAPILLNEGRPGEKVNIEANLVPGRVNVVDFYADWCGPCRELAPRLEALAAKNGMVVLKVDILNWGSPVAKQFDIHSIPHLIIYDKSGKKIAEGGDAMEYLHRL